MYAADAAGGENLDAGHVGNNHGGGNGGSPVLTPGAQYGQIPAGGLGNGLALLAEVLNLLGGKASLQTAADDGDGGRHGTVVPDNLLHSQSGFHVLGIGHTVGDDGGLQSHHRLTGSQRFGYLGFYIQILVQHNHSPFLSYVVMAQSPMRD